MRSQPQAAAGPLVTANEHPAAPARSSSQARLERNSNTNPETRIGAGKNQKKAPQSPPPPNPIAQLEKVLAVWVWGAVVSGDRWFWGGCVTPAGSHQNCGVLLREGCPWTGIGVLGVAGGGDEPQDGVPPPRDRGKQSL